MAKGITDTSNYSDIADAIRGKNGSQDTYKPGEMPAAITAIPTGGGGIQRGVNANGVYGMPTQNFTFSLPSDATDIAGYALNNAFRNCTTITSADLSPLTTVSGGYAFDNAFYGCTALASVDLSSLTTASGGNAFNNAFYGCTSLTSVDFSSLTTVSGGYAFNNTFNGCTSLTSVNFSALTTVSSYGIFNRAFQGCTSLASLSFPALTTSSFGSNTDQFSSMLVGVTGCTLHFPAATQAKVSTLTGYPNFGGSNTTVLFDL